MNKKQQIFKCVAALVLAFALMVGSVPVAASETGQPAGVLSMANTIEFTGGMITDFVNAFRVSSPGDTLIANIHNFPVYTTIEVPVGRTLIIRPHNMLALQGMNPVLAVTDNHRHFYVPAGSTLIIDQSVMAGNPIFGGEGYAHPILQSGGTFSGGVYVADGGTFIMNAGEITGNTSRAVVSYGTFQMNGGAISGNSNGGVHVLDGTFTMTDGIISDNADIDGAGVYVSQAEFTMHGGTIENNTATRGGGVFLSINSTFTMNGGYILDNVAAEDGGGIFVAAHPPNYRTPLEAADYPGLTIGASAVFYGNCAGSAAVPHASAVNITRIASANTSIHAHLLNNYDINFASEPESNEPIIEIYKSANALPNGRVNVGSTVTYTISVENSGNADSGSIVITDNIPAGMTLVPDSATHAPSIVDNTLTWTIPVIEAGTTVQVSFQVTVDSLPSGVNERIFTNTAVVNGYDTNTVELTARRSSSSSSDEPATDDNDAPEEPDVQEEIEEPPSFVPAPAPNIPFNPIHYAYMIGDNYGMVRPGASITRAEVATIFFRLITDEHRAEIWSQTNPFPDVEIDDWFNNAVSTMTNAGILAGMPDGTFQPNRAITRAEFAVAMTRFFTGFPEHEINMFTDIYDHWAVAEINAAARVGWVTGFPDGTFAPDQSITRAEAAALVNRVLRRLPRTVNDLLPNMIIWPDNMDTYTWFYLYIQEATNSNEYMMQADGIHKTGVGLLTPPDWTLLERPYSSPWDFIR